MFISTYNIIYADPSWRYDYKDVQGVAENHYFAVSIDKLYTLPVERLVSKDCLLFLWVTFPMLSEALWPIKARGSSFKAVTFVWLKQNRESPTWFYGLDRWTRGNAETCLLTTHGKSKRRSTSIRQFIISLIEQHSRKPDVTREEIVELAGDLPRMELFARQKTPSWDVRGNEVEYDLILT